MVGSSLSARRGGVLPELSIREPDDQESAVQDPGHVDAGGGDAEGDADEVGQRESPRPCQNRADDLGAGCGSPTRCSSAPPTESARRPGPGVRARKWWRS